MQKPEFVNMAAAASNDEQVLYPYLGAAVPQGLLVSSFVLTNLELQDVSDEIGSLAVNTLALLRGEPESSSGDSRRSYPLPSPSTRRRRKPARPTVRTLF